MGAQNRLRPRGAAPGFDPNATNPYDPGRPEYLQWEANRKQQLQDQDDRLYWDETVAQADATRGRYEEMLAGLNRPEDIQAIRNRYGQVISEAGDSERYNQRTQEMLQRSDVALGNRFAGMGMGGSSAAFGAMAEAGRGIEMSMRDRRLGEALQGAQFETGMEQILFQRRLAEMAAQGGLMEMDENQIRALQALMAGQDAANAQATAGILSGLGTVAGGVLGTVVGGPVGGVAGASLGGQAGNLKTPGTPGYGFDGPVAGGGASPYFYSPYDFPGGS